MRVRRDSDVLISISSQAQQLTDKYTSEIDGLITTAKKELAKA